MKRFFKPCIFPIVAIFLLASAEVQATIYKCVSADAEVYYNDKPCPKATIERKIKAVKDPVNGYIAPTTFEKDTVKMPSSSVVVGKSIGSANNSKHETSENQSQGVNININNGINETLDRGVLNKKKFQGAKSGNNPETQDELMQTIH